MKLTSISANEFIKILLRIGFTKMRQKGSHVFFKHTDGRTTIVPNHPGEVLDRGLLNKILKHDVQISRVDFLYLYRK
jgi:predicted RNA binding protein YcfA (HicA-like mRNA interferase family)